MTPSGARRYRPTEIISDPYGDALSSSTDYDTDSMGDMAPPIDISSNLRAPTSPRTPPFLPSQPPPTMPDQAPSNPLPASMQGPPRPPASRTDAARAELGPAPAVPKPNMWQRLAAAGIGGAAGFVNAREAGKYGHGAIPDETVGRAESNVLAPGYVRARGTWEQRRADMATEEKMREQEISNAASAEAKEAQAGLNRDKGTRQLQMDEERKQSIEQKDADSKRRAFAKIVGNQKPIYQPKGAPIPPGFTALTDPDVPGQDALVRGGLQRTPKELVPYLPGHREGDAVSLDEMQAALAAKYKSDLQDNRPPPQTAAAGQYAALIKAHEDYNNPASSPQVRAAALQVIQAHQPLITTTKTKDPNTGADIVTRAPNRMAVPGANPGVAPPPAPVAPGAVAPPPAGTLRPSVAPKQVATPLRAGGFMRIQYSPDGPVTLPATPQAAGLQAEMAASLKEVLANVEGGRPASQAINAAIQYSRPNPTARATYGQALRRFIDENGMMTALVPLSTSSRQMSETARSILPHVDEIESMISRLDAAGKLGPLAGRWNDFMTRKWGAGDEDYAKLQSLMGLFTTGMMRAHVGARGGVGIMSHFQDLFNAKNMNGQTLTAGLEGARSFLNEYAKMGRIQQPGTGKAGAAPAEDLSKVPTEELMKRLMNPGVGKPIQQ